MRDAAIASGDGVVANRGAAGPGRFAGSPAGQCVLRRRSGGPATITVGLADVAGQGLARNGHRNGQREQKGERTLRRVTAAMEDVVHFDFRIRGRDASGEGRAVWPPSQDAGSVERQRCGTDRQQGSGRTFVRATRSLSATSAHNGMAPVRNPLRWRVLNTPGRDEEICLAARSIRCGLTPERQWRGLHVENKRR